MQTPDFGSACTYLESGISFLHGCYWEDSYNLSLHLYKNAVFIQYALGKNDLMMKRVNEVIDNATSFDDKLDTYNVLIQSLLSSKSVSSAFEQSFLVLEQLGESFPTIPEDEMIGRDLIEVKSLLGQHTPSSISNLKPMDHPQKVNAMVNVPTFHAFMIFLLVGSIPKFLPLLFTLQCRNVYRCLPLRAISKSRVSSHLWHAG